ncbi:MAG: hypothetical protein IKS64_04575 [Muribaculaceae bacterium]|nr:hypothetical protein [Muribaculaceae bacterium]MBR6432108.1 hypothetical protein [Muribaculaceae bacterium]
MKKHKVTIYIDFDEILNYVYAQSAWYAAHNDKVRIITPDNNRMIMLKLKEGYALLRDRVLGYLDFDNYNPNVDSRNIIMTFAFNNEPRLGFDAALHDTVVALLAHFVLMSFYGEVDPRGMEHGSSIFNLEWRRYMAKLMIAFAHDEL